MNLRTVQKIAATRIVNNPLPLMAKSIHKLQSLRTLILMYLKLEHT